MGFFNNFPYTDFHELNLDWILSKLGLLDQSKDAAEQAATEAKASETAAAGSATSAEESAEIAKTYAERGRRFIFIGDSYADGWDPETSTYIKSWVGYVKDYLGLTSYNSYESHEGGAGFAQVGLDGHNFQELLELVAPSVESPETITDIIVLGGYNDRNHVSEISNAISGFSAYAKRNFVSAKVHIGFVGRNVSTTKNQTTVNNVYLALEKYHQAQKVAYVNSIEYCAREIGMFFNDGVHPNALGQRAIAQGLYEYILNGSANIFGVLTPVKFDSPQVSIPFSFQQIGADAILYTGNRTVSGLSISGTLDGTSTSIDFGVIKNGPFLTPIFNAGFTFICGANTADGFVNCVMRCTITTDNHLIANPKAYKPDGSYWANDITSLNIDTTMIKLPASWV